MASLHSNECINQHSVQFLPTMRDLYMKEQVVQLTDNKAVSSKKAVIKSSNK